MKIVEFAGIANRPNPGSKTELYLDTNTGVLFRWTGSAFAAMAMPHGSMVSGSWMECPSVFRLRLTGTGTVIIDSKDALGNITPAIYTYTISGATNQIEFPYAGDSAVAIRATLTGTTTAEVI